MVLLHHIYSGVVAPHITVRQWLLHHILVAGADIARSKVKGSRSRKEPLSHAMENDQEIIMEDIITEDIITEETPAEDMELRQ